MGEEKTSATSSVNVGDLLSGTVEHIAPYGAFIRLESGQKAMVHISELSHNFVKKVEDVLTVAEKVTAKVIKIDEKGRIDLSIKALQVRELQRPVKREEDFEKKLTTFLKASDEKIADLNNKTKDPRASKKRAPKK